MRVADGYDSAIIGYAYNPISRKNVVVYEVDKILKEYKKIKRKEKSNFNQIKKLGLVDKNGRPL